ncbi:hypothetical protein KAM344_34770 [Aeromonas caviae]|uniref:glycosyltransferase n=1 Tax=Aeromonas caviae TaxID=648 RepID=UPI00191E0C18|nr:glycosyltransferase [Aeromonas caviae]MBL0559085.1 glycosyltransferase [Aeromonas caviae]MDY7799417.1 glycosyltransferase [Aeromonas caviae]GJC01754.1 hypothetical protein KAM384_30350 [Aeromonas caviae]GKQ68312.1 hypothetical protein KAM344_34770 [Aeromonas caviae]
MKKILFINLYFEIGGVETLLLRIIRSLNNEGYSSTVLLLRKRYDPCLLKQLREIANVIFLSDIRCLSPKKIKSKLGASFNHIFVTINDALLVGAILQRWLYPGSHLIAGVYQTEIFCAPITWRYLHRRVINDLFCYCVPDQNKIMVNEATRDYHQLQLNHDLSLSKVVPLIVDIEKYAPPKREQVNRNKIVSIGRLVDFKTYNLTFFDVLLSLNDKGLYFEWHVYGDGPLDIQMQELIERYGLQEQVFLHGVLNYSNFKSVVSDAFVFVGSGTAIIEAAACGVPVIPAIEYAETAVSYGFFNEIEGISFCEPGVNKKSVNIISLILMLSKLDASEYNRICFLSTEKAEIFSEKNVVNLYLSAFSNSLDSKSRISLSQLLSFVWRFIISKANAFKFKD